MSEKPSFFSELKRRNVYKVAVAYAVVAWLLIQAASIFLPTFDAPSWVMKAFLICIILCFPVALVMSWAFEITPEGIKLESEVTPDESITRRTGRKIIGITVVLAVIAAGLMLFQFLRPAASPAPRPASDELRRDKQSETAAAPIPEMSIAVLPFDNLSHDPENAYFSEGIQDEILTRLAKIAQLKVISRTSTQRFKSSGGDLRQIAEQLGVANILEGSVQKVNDQVRVNVQLIKANPEAHLWAEVYDRKLNDIFAVESEIARAVAATLQAKLTGSAEHVLASRPTQDPEAYQLYLKGRYFWNRRTDENLRKAIELFQQALEKDPAYALAYAGLADGYALLPVYSNTEPRTSVERARAAAHRAIELDDSLAEAHTALGNALLDDLQFAAAETEFRRAISLNPNYATAHQWFGEGLAAQGRFEEALTEVKQAHDLDPLSLIINTVYGSILNSVGRSDEAVQQLRRTLEMESSFSVATFILGQVWESRGDFNQAATAYESAWAANHHPIRYAVLACLYVRMGKAADARKILDELTSRAQHEYVQSYALALVHLALGDKEKALTFLEKAYEERGIQIGGDTCSLKIDKRLDPLRADPRFQKLLAKFMGQAE